MANHLRDAAPGFRGVAAVLPQTTAGYARDVAIGLLVESFFRAAEIAERAAFLAHVSLAFRVPSHTVPVLRSAIR